MIGRPRKRELELPIIGVLAVSLLLYFAAETVVKKENEAADKALISAGTRENERLLRVVNNRESENRRKNAETLYGACVRERDNALSELNSRILNDAADSQSGVPAEPTHRAHLPNGTSAASLRNWRKGQQWISTTSRGIVGASQPSTVAQSAGPEISAMPATSTTSQEVPALNVRSVRLAPPVDGGTQWPTTQPTNLQSNVLPTPAATPNAASLNASSATDIGYASGRAVTAANTNSSGDQMRRASRVVTDEPCEGVPPCQTEKMNNLSADANTHTVFATPKSDAKARRVEIAATDITQSSLPHPPHPETNPLCFYELATGETQVNIDLAGKWATIYDEPWMRCRGDVPRSAYQYVNDCAARHESSCDGIQWFYANGYPLKNVWIEFRQDHDVPPRCEGCNHLGVTYGVDPELPDAQVRWEPRDCTTDCVVYYQVGELKSANAPVKMRWY